MITENISICWYLSEKLVQSFFGPASEGSYNIGVVGNNWLVGWLVGNAFFSETAPRIFLIFCMKLGDYEGKKVIEPHFWKKFLIWRYSRKRRQISAKSDILIFFSKTAVKNFFSFWPDVSTKYEFQFEWNLFSRKNYNLEIFVLEIVKKLPKLRFLAIFATSHHEFFFILYIVIGGHDV